MLMKKEISSTTIVFPGKNAITLVNLDVILFFFGAFFMDKKIWTKKNPRSKAGGGHMKVTLCFPDIQRFVRKETFWNWPISTASKRCPNPCERCKKHGDDGMVKCRKIKNVQFYSCFWRGRIFLIYGWSSPKRPFSRNLWGCTIIIQSSIWLKFWGKWSAIIRFPVDLNMMHNTWNTLYNRPFKFVWNMTDNDPCYFRSFWF